MVQVTIENLQIYYQKKKSDQEIEYKYIVYQRYMIYYVLLWYSTYVRGRDACRRCYDYLFTNDNRMVT